mgnify:CR=1 FL=1
MGVNIAWVKDASIKVLNNGTRVFELSPKHIDGIAKYRIVKTPQGETYIGRQLADKTNVVTYLNDGIGVEYRKGISEKLTPSKVRYEELYGVRDMIETIEEYCGPEASQAARAYSEAMVKVPKQQPLSFVQKLGTYRDKHGMKLLAPSEIKNLLENKMNETFPHNDLYSSRKRRNIY